MIKLRRLSLKAASRWGLAAMIEPSLEGCD
jgi:hypothetical protein